MALAFLLGLIAAVPAWAMGTNLPDCPVSEVMTLTQDTRLDPACRHRTAIHIAASHVELDCRGALIDARGLEYGILIGGKQPVSHVTVRNCHIRGGGNGIRVARTEPDGVKARRHDRDTLYRITPHHVVIEGVSIRDSARAGIYLDDYVSRVRIARSHISGSGSSGIYLEHSSRENEILDSTLTDNGYGSFPRYRFGSGLREAIAIDSSAHNRVEGNHIHGNAAGGIFLYKNCQEHIHTNPQSVPRWQHADHNLIRGNTIENEKVGVWIASRQSRDLSSWDCGDAPYLAPAYFPDHASHNQVQGNRFVDVEVGVRVEDDDNTVTGNTFVATLAPFERGATLREKTLGKPLQGVVFEGNTFNPAPAK
jgi:nitrous oxidase accessory protein NosD